MGGSIINASVSVIAFNFDLNIVRLAKTDVQVLIEERSIERIFSILLEVSYLLKLLVDVSEFRTPLFESFCLHHFLEGGLRLTFRHPLQLAKKYIVILKKRMLHHRGQLLQLWIFI